MGNLIERTVLLTNKDSQGNTTMDFPITKIENVEGAEELVVSIEQIDSGLKIIIKTSGADSEKIIPVAIFNTNGHLVFPNGSEFWIG